MRKLPPGQWEFGRRARPIIAFFILAQVVMLFVGMAGLECIDVLRAYAAGESRWSRAEKTAVVHLVRFIETREARLLPVFERNLAVLADDRIARTALELPHPRFDLSQRGYLAGKTDPRDVPGMMWGYVLLHDVPPFASPVAIWQHTDPLVTALEQAERAARDLARRSATPAQLQALRGRVLHIDGQLTRYAASYSASMGHASRFAKVTVATAYFFMALLACAFWVWRVRAVGLDAERRVVQHHERLADFVALGSDWFCELDGDMRLTFASGDFDALGIRSPSSVIGKGWLEAVEAVGFQLEPGASTSPLIEALEARTAFRGEHIRQVLIDGSLRYWSLTGKPLLDGERFVGYRVSAHNVTDFIDAQTRLSRARDEAERANKAKSAFLANMGHELRTPLNAILGFSGIIEGELVGKVGNQRYVGYARDIGFAGEHLLGIINGLLDHARFESGRLELHEQRFDPAKTIRAVEMLCGPAAAKNNTNMTVCLPSHLPMIVGDDLRIRQSLINVVANAIKFSPGGTVEIAVSCDDVFVIRVRDNGIGMTQDEITRALEPFEQIDNGLNRKFEGTGLGLPLAKGLIKLHGGELDVQSWPSKGTLVTISLPASRIAARQTEAA